MTVTITKGATTLTPTLCRVETYDFDNQAGNLEHRLTNGGIATTLRDDEPATGTLEFLFATRTDAVAARDLHRTAGVFEFVDTAKTDLNMDYVRRGSMTLTLDPETRLRWLLSVGYRQVNA